MAQDDDNIIQIHRRRKPECYAGDGKGDQEKTFTAKLNKLARQPNGRLHTRETLEAELNRQADEWEKTKYWHPRCRDDVIESLLKHIDQLDANFDELDRERARLANLELALIQASDDPIIGPTVHELLDKLGLSIKERQKT